MSVSFNFNWSTCSLCSAKEVKQSECVSLTQTQPFPQVLVSEQKDAALEAAPVDGDPDQDMVPEQEDQVEEEVHQRSRAGDLDYVCWHPIS